MNSKFSGILALKFVEIERKFLKENESKRLSEVCGHQERIALYISTNWS